MVVYFLNFLGGKIVEEVKESNFKLYDIECYKHYFQIGIRDFITKDTISLEVSELEDDREKIYNYFINYDKFLVSFNGIYYDNYIIFYFLSNYSTLKDLPREEFNLKIKQFSDKVINQDIYYEDIKKYKYYKKKWIDIDLFLYWSKMLRLSKKISLKSLGIQLGYPVVQELPFHPDSTIQKEDILVLREYNLKHDLGILDLLCTNMKEEIKLRESINKDYELDCWSWDAPKIASEALLFDYCNDTGYNPNSIRKTRFERNPIKIKDIFEGFDPNFRLDIFKNLYNRILNSVNNFSEDLIVNHSNTSIKLSYGVGGLHSVNQNESYSSDNLIKTETADFESLYPNLIINYNCIRFPQVLDKYKKIKTERVEAKKNKEKKKDTFLKLILNATSGLLDNEHSWLYYPEGALRLRLIGQIILTKCIEECIINNWQVISANTDGIEVLVPKEELDDYKLYLNVIAEEFNLKLEFENYKKIVYKNVNNYICSTESGKVKRKGFFKLDFDEKGNREIPLGDSVNELVIAKALNAYYIKDISPEEFIGNPDKYDLHIYDFCKSNKISKDYEVFYNGTKQQNLNRYYFSKLSPYLFKKKKTKNTLEHINVGLGVILFNNYEEKSWKDYNINYQYYISCVNNLIEEINNHNQLTLF